MAKTWNDMYLDEKLVYMHLQADSDKEALDKMAGMLLQEGIVKESYIPAVKAREIEYATGLQCDEMGVAIPHTDAEHVNIQAIGIGILDKPVKFIQMGTDNQEVEVELIFMLAIKEPHKQMDLLQSLMMAFMDKDKLSSLAACETPKEVIKMFLTFLK